jgi:hypothetical protein
MRDHEATGTSALVRHDAGVSARRALGLLHLAYCSLPAYFT